MHKQTPAKSKQPHPGQAPHQSSPHQSTQNRNQVILTQLNRALDECGLPHVRSLNDDRTTDGSAVCVKFAGALLENVLGGSEPNTVRTRENDPGADTRDETFFQVSIQGEPSDLNHVFCVYFSNHSAIVMQTWKDREVSLLRKLARERFLKAWGELRNNNIAASYEELFGVKIGQFQVNEHLGNTRTSLNARDHPTQ